MKTKQRAVIAVAVIVLLAAAVLGAKPAYNLYRDISFYHGERTEAEKTVKAFAEENGISYGEYPQSLIDLYERNPETKDFVLNYPFRKDTGVDLSVWKGSRTVPLFLQWDPMWGYEKYGKGFIAETGCGPTCLAMVGYYLTGDENMNPRQVARFAQENGYYSRGSGSSWTLISEGSEGLGLKATEIPLVKKKMVDALEAGKPIICAMREGGFHHHGTLHRPAGREGRRISGQRPQQRGQFRKAVELRADRGTDPEPLGHGKSVKSLKRPCRKEFPQRHGVFLLLRVLLTAGINVGVFVIAHFPVADLQLPEDVVLPLGGEKAFCRFREFFQRHVAFPPEEVPAGGGAVFRPVQKMGGALDVSPGECRRGLHGQRLVQTGQINDLPRNAAKEQTSALLQVFGVIGRILPQSGDGFQKFQSVWLPPISDGFFGEVEPDEDFQQLPLPIVNFIRGAVLRQRLHCPGVIFPVKQLPDSGHDLLIRGTNGIFFQKITHGLAQPRSKTAQCFHGRPGGAVLNAGEHIPGDLVPAERPLGQSCFQPRQAQFFSKLHSCPPFFPVVERIIPYLSPFFHCYKNFICYFSEFRL